MSTPITFGVELEFCLAFQYEDEPPVSPPSKILTFPISLKTERPSGMRSSGPIINQRIFQHIGATLASSNFDVNLDRLAEGNISVWEITRDDSINSEDGEDGIHNVGVEVRSPALIFCPESLKAVEEVCELLTSTYRIKNNISTGLHIHLGHSQLGFAFSSLQKLIAFIYTFEPQLSSLHPVHRIAHMYGNCMRDTCFFTAEFQIKHGRRPTARDFGANVFRTQRRGDLLRDSRDVVDAKNGNYNFKGVDDWTDPIEKRQTVEFRQHEGVMDGERIAMWIRVLVGIIRFVEEGDLGSYFRLLTATWNAEVWEKEGDGRDGEREVLYGPTLADHGFTIIDLLRYIGCEEQAEYFEGKWYRHAIKHRPREKQHALVLWEYEQAFPEDSPEFAQAKKLRELWEVMSTCAEAAEEIEGLNGLLGFDPDGEIWPAHWVEEEESGSGSGSGLSEISDRESSEEEFSIRKF